MDKPEENRYIRWLETLTSDDIPIVGRKNAALGDMVHLLQDKDIRTLGGFATTAEAYRQFLKINDLEEKIRDHLEDIHNGDKALESAAKAIQRLFSTNQLPDEIAEAIRQAYRELCRRYEQDDLDVAVRGSTAAQDLPQVSFVGQEATFLNVTGEGDLLEACRKCYDSLFSERAIAYREEHGLDHVDVALAIGVHKMVHADKGGSGIIFTRDTESGFPDVVVINAAWGLGTGVGQGNVTPDEYKIFKLLLDNDDLTPIIKKERGNKKQKMVYASSGGQTTKTVATSKDEQHAFVLNDEEIIRLARLATKIEAYYDQPVNLEWAKDGQSGQLFIVEVQPETSQKQQAGLLKRYELKEETEPLLTGLAVGEAIAAGEVKLIKTLDQVERFEKGNILVTHEIDPDWIPILKQAAAVITESGGRTSHAAVISRELGIPAVIDTEEATKILKDGQQVTISCAEGDRGYVYEGILAFEEKEIELEKIPDTRTQIMMNIASPAAAFRWWQLPCQGIGLARMEFIINNVIRIHPLALIHFDELEDKETRQQIIGLTQGYENKTAYFVEKLTYGIAEIAASQYPNPVIVRMSDFKTSEYADLIGGQPFEPEEENPMLGFRGASRYYSDHYRAGFALECQAIKRVREEIGLANVVVMIPFCRTPAEADQVLGIMAEQGLVRGQKGLKVYVMAEIPSNLVLADRFAERFDGFSIGSNDLTQLVLGVDRNSETLAHLFDEHDEAIIRMIQGLIETAHKANCQVGICGQAPSDYPDFAAFLVEAGIDSISLNPDSVIEVKRRVAEVENSNKKAVQVKA